MTEHVVVERKGPVQVIRMNRPDKKNALTRAMYAAMAEALTAGDADKDVRVHVIFGVPGAFSSGNDIADFMAVAMGSNVGGEVFDFMMAVAKAEKPLVTGVDGIAVGIGTTIHFHADMTFATPRTLFRTPFVDLGIVAELGSTLIGPAMLGHQRAFSLLAMGEGLSADRAKSAGFIYDVVEEDDLEKDTLAAAERVAAKPPEALRLTRDLLRGPREPIVERIKEEGRLFSERLRSDEAKAAFAAFLSKKK